MGLTSITQTIGILDLDADTDAIYVIAKIFNI